MKRLLVFSILVIVLVSLNWFRVVRADGLDNLTAEQKAKLLLQQSHAPAPGTESQYYKSQKIYDDAGGVADTADNASLDSAARPSGSVTTADSRLSAFGVGMFRGSADMEAAITMPSASDYILGPGDNLIVYLWGRVEREYNLTIDREGKIFVPRIGEIVCWGLSLDQFTERSRKRFSTVYSDFELTISLGKIRSIRVYVTGEVQSPGAYTVSSLSSLFNVIYVAGGPNNRGSMRSIRLLRGGKTKVEYDLYDFLLKGDNAADVHLQTGDVIFVPIVGPRVEVRGEVKRPALYELKGEQTAMEVLQLAGSPTPTAHLDRVMLERVGGKKEWEVLDLNLNPDSDQIDDISLIDGDRLTVSSIFEARTNMVALYGQVKHPGYYERDDSTRLSTLLRQGQLQPYDVYYQRADLFRRHHNWRTEVIPVDLEAILAGDLENDFLLADRDSLHIYSIDDVEWDHYVFIEGEVKNPGPYPLYDKMTVNDLVFLAGSYSRTALRHRLEVARIDSAGEVELINVEQGSSGLTELVLQEDDHVYVRRLPEWERNRTVIINGEVMYPGTYTLSNRYESLSDLISRAGGFTDRAFPRGTVFERHSIVENLEKINIRRILANSQPVYEDSTGNRRRDTLLAYDSEAMNRIIIDMDQIIATKGREGDIMLEAGDRVTIPSTPSGISVMGAVAANGTLKFMPNSSVKNYINRAGGFTRQADKDGTRLISATGEVVSGGGALGKKVRMGDILLVPSKVEKRGNWIKNASIILSAATGVLTSVFIISKL